MNETFSGSSSSLVNAFYPDFDRTNEEIVHEERKKRLRTTAPILPINNILNPLFTSSPHKILNAQTTPNNNVNKINWGSPMHISPIHPTAHSTVLNNNENKLRKEEGKEKKMKSIRMEANNLISDVFNVVEKVVDFSKRTGDWPSYTRVVESRCMEFSNGLKWEIDSIARRNQENFETKSKYFKDQASSTSSPIGPQHQKLQSTESSVFKKASKTKSNNSDRNEKSEFSGNEKRRLARSNIRLSRNYDPMDYDMTF